MASIGVTADTVAAGDTLSIYRNPIVGTLANNTQIVPININFESNQQADALAYKWDGTGTAGIGGLTLAANSVVGPFPLNAGANFTGAPVVLGQGSIIAIAVTTTAGTPNITAFFRFYFDQAGSV